MGINIKAIKKGIVKAIKLNPTQIILKRDNKVSDGYGGFYIDKDMPNIDIANIDIFLNDTTASKGKSQYSEGGRREDITGVSALIVYSDNFTVLEDDFFIFNEKKYIIKYPVNVYDAYWNVELEVVDNGS